MQRSELDKKITEAAKSILSYCVVRTSNNYEAEDLAQDIMLEIYKSAANIRNDDAFYGFMWSVAANVYKQWCRKKQLRNETELEENIPSEFSFDEDDDHLDIMLLRRELALLVEKYRRATILYYMKNKSCQEIANILSVSESMVKYLLFKSRKILKEGMSMERTYGEQSYNPKNLMVLYMGEGPNQYWNMVNGQLIRQNILWACYNDKLTGSEIALQIGVSLPYIETDLKTLTKAGLLVLDGNFYRTNIIILTEDFRVQMENRIQVTQKKIADVIKKFVEEHADDVRKIGFEGCDMSYNSLKWQISSILERRAYAYATDKIFERMPVTAFGEATYVWGTQYCKTGFSICGISAEECQMDINWNFMDWEGNTKFNHNDFYSNRKWLKMYRKLARGIKPDNNEFEMEIVADLIRCGYAYLKDGNVNVTIPVFTKGQLEELNQLAQTTIDEISGLQEQMIGEIAGVLREHTPVHLRKQVKDIAGMCLWDEGVAVPMTMLVNESWLSAQWDANEYATSFAVLEDEVK